MEINWTAILTTVIGGIIGILGGYISTAHTHDLKMKDREMRLRNQLSYLIDLYERCTDVSAEVSKGKEHIASLIITSEIFLIDNNYKDDILFVKLSAIEKQEILFWLNQWEKVNEILLQQPFTQIVFYEFLKKYCPEQKKNIKRLLPKIKTIGEDKLIENNKNWFFKQFLLNIILIMKDWICYACKSMYNIINIILRFIKRDRHV